MPTRIVNFKARYLIWGRVLIAALSVYGLTASFDTAHAQTRFLRGWRDGIFTAYAVVESNGREYRTDQMGPAFNQNIWKMLSPSDKLKLAHTYSHMQNHIRDHFGSDGQANINRFYNQQTGWADLVAAMQKRHAAKRYPELSAAFGVGVVLEIPDCRSKCWSVINLPPYQEALKLEREVRADFAVGREIYSRLSGANWEQIGVAVKGISGPLLKIIVDSFITGFVTHGAAATSDLLATAINFREDLRVFILEQADPVHAEASPADLIAKLDQFIAAMEVTGLTAIDRVNSKLVQLAQLASGIRQAEESCRALRQREAASAREDLMAIIAVTPAPVGIDTSVKSAADQWSELQSQTAALQKQLQAEQAVLWAQYTSAPPVRLHEDLLNAFDGFTSGFDNRYRMLKAELSDIDRWVFDPMLEAIEAAAIYDEIGPVAETAINDARPRIDPLEAKALGLDTYAHELGGGDLPSVQFRAYGLRNLNQYIEIIATTNRTLEKVLEDIVDQQAFSVDAQSRIQGGRARRVQWLNKQSTLYESLRFNFEASLSQNIAAIKQLDRLHADSFYKKLDSLPYGGVPRYIYRVDMDYIKAVVQAGGEEGRLKALWKLRDLHTQERGLIRRLEIARSFHEHDRQALIDFFRMLCVNYELGYYSSDAVKRILADVRRATGKILYSPDELAGRLIDDITYDIGPMGEWVRTSTDLSAPVHLYDEYTMTPAPIEQLTLKPSSYYQLLDLYDKLRNEQTRLLVLPQDQFNGFSTDTWNKIGTLQEIMMAEGVDWPGSPGRNLVRAAYLRHGNLVSRYHGQAVENEPCAVKGMVTTAAGSGIPDAALMLCSSAAGRASQSVHSGHDGRFEIEQVYPGNYTITPRSARGYTFTPSEIHVTMGNNDILTSFIAHPGASTGYGISGYVADAVGAGLGGVTITVTPDDDPAGARVLLTGADGVYAFEELPPGTWTVRPMDANLDITPAVSSINLQACAANVDFLVRNPPLSTAAPGATHPMGASADNMFFVRAGNRAWVAESDRAWVAVTVGRGSSNGQVVYNLEANDTGAPRTAKLTVTDALGFARAFTVAQAHKIGPMVQANGAHAALTVMAGQPVTVSVMLDPHVYAGYPADWWCVAYADTGLWFYLNSALQWTLFDGNLSECAPAHQGPLAALPETVVLHTGLPAGKYTVWFAADSPMDGIVNLGGDILLDSVAITVQ